LVAFRRRVDQLGELWRDPLRQSGRGAAAAGYRPRHAGSKKRFRCRRSAMKVWLSLGDGEARADRQGGELIDCVAASPPVGEFLFIEARGHVRMPFAGLRPVSLSS
jgi:hypothetical protein